ncbi:hypothetical protein KDW_06040 [Dictyobacter vulcani]|uniref:Uncharacterized protein n=2 Tax=Dictyobacter vulcani TaxID=2607529 RepID=A0A5J4KHT7_9CHLR|nr:hypothetical protein KDW_06040 [Dictyobacter vulcani]
MIKMREYKLELEYLLPLLAEMRQQGVLSTLFIHGINGLTVPCMAQIGLRDGQAMRCRIVTEDGKICASGNKALRLLYGLGPRNWHLDVQPSAPLRISPPSESVRYSSDTGPIKYSSNTGSISLATQFSLRIPRRSLYASADTLKSLSRSQKRIFLLVDGMRNIGKIAVLMSMRDEKEAEKVVMELEALGFITF